jgi:hypothetical protein
MRIRLLVLSTALLLCGAGAASAASSALAGPCAAGNATTTASYRMVLEIGPREEMYLPSEVKARHIKRGQIMLGGEMSMVEQTAGTKIFNLEVHVCTRRTGAVVTGLKPRIVVSGPGAGMASTNVASAVMVGVGRPLSDYHYGNDVALKPGGRVTVVVTVRGQLARFQATAPR